MYVRVLINKKRLRMRKTLQVSVGAEFRNKRRKDGEELAKSLERKAEL